jgi:3-methylfumaryl-CoA hydratase
MSNSYDIEHLQSWIGKQEQIIDSITPELLERFTATVSGHSVFSAQLPLGIHWCLAQPAVSHAELGIDGHPAKGGFLPPVPLPRRMWASSSMKFHGEPSVGAPIEKTSTIADVPLKQSKTAGTLIFLTLDHSYRQNGGTLIEDRQSIVYREPSAYKQSEPQELPSADHVKLITPDSRLLFRYSALTFNGHRIHYDHDYTTQEEGYPGLVVHGPLMATLLMNLAQAQHPDQPLREFAFRGVAPAFVNQELQLKVLDNNAQSLEIRNSVGALVMSATAKFAG